MPVARVAHDYVGGGFGCKGTPWSHVVLAALAAKVVGRPVKLVVTRQQMFSLVGHPPRQTVGSAVKLACLELVRTLARIAVADPQSPLHGLAPIRLWRSAAS